MNIHNHLVGQVVLGIILMPIMNIHHYVYEYLIIYEYS